MAAAAPVILVSPDELEKLVRAAVRAELADHYAIERPNRPQATLTIDEAAELARVSTRTIRRLIRAGRLPSSKLADGGSSRVFVPRAAVERLREESSH